MWSGAIMKKQKDKNSLYYRVLIAIVLIVMIVVGVYTGLSQKQMREYAQYVVQQNVQQISDNLDRSILSATDSIRFTSYLVAKTMSGTDADEINAILDSLENHTPFNFIEYIEKDGTSTTDMGEHFDASDREYYWKGIAGNTGVWINYEPKSSGEYLINFYTPLYYEEEIVGVLTGTLGADTDFLPMIQNNFFGEEMIGVLCDENDRILSSTVPLENASSLEGLLDYLQVEEADRADIYAHINAGAEGSFFIHSADGKTIASVYTNILTGWKVIQIVPSSSLFNAMKQHTSGAYIVMAVISILLLVFLFYVKMDSGRQQAEVLKEKERVVQNYEQIFLATASDTYKGIRQLDLESGFSEYIYFENNMVKQKNIGDWMTWLKTQQNNIHPHDWNRIRDFLTLEHIRQMKEGVTYQENYRSVVKNEKGYYSTYATTVSIIYVDDRRTALLTTIDTTAAVISEMEQKHLMEAAASIYLSMHVIDIENDRLESINCAKHIEDVVDGRQSDVQSLFYETMGKLTDEQYMDAMMAFIDLSTLDARMEDTKTITLEFLGTKTGWCRGRFIAVEYNQEHKLNKVLWVVENIDTEKRNANHLQYLSETDLMTGIRNRGSGEKKIKELIATGHEGMFALLDVDKFKTINDTFGHGVGDQVLIAIAKCMKESFRETDTVLRLGGDEFAVFAEGATEEQLGAMLIERFFDNIGNIDIPELGSRKISVSLGAAFIRADSHLNFETLYHNADSCTYRSKAMDGCSYSFYEGRE